MNRKFKVGDVPAGTVIETYHYNRPSGNFYRVGDFTSPSKETRYAYCRFTQRMVVLACCNDCVVFNAEEISIMGGF